MKLTIGIKTLNEERRIAACLESALAAARRWGGEVVLADSGSSDRTIEIALGFPVRIVQLANTDEKSCGAGAQLAFQYARGAYFCLLDADMVLNPDFPGAAIAALEAQPDLAGVGGRLREMNTQSEGFEILAAATKNNKQWLPGPVDRLDGGGLYRMSAIRDVGYFADRNLHAFEEFELGARLRCRGWRLARIDCASVDHYGHQIGGYHLLWRRLMSGYSWGAGEVLRSALSKPQFGIVLRDLGHVRHAVAVMVWWLLCLAVSFAPILPVHRLLLLLGLLGLPLLGLSIRRGSPRLGLYSLAAWNVSALGFILGFLSRRGSPRLPLAAIELSRPSAPTL